MIKKGQSSVIGFLLITLIVLVVVSGTFFWAKELLEDSNQFSEISRVENRILDLDKAIREVANEQSQRTVNFNIDNGYLFIENNHTITFRFGENPPDQLYGENIIIFGNASVDGPCLNYSLTGKLGEDRSSCIIRNGRDISINYLRLNETSTDDCYGVQFKSGGTASATKGSHNVLITYSHTNTTTECNTSYIQVINVDIN